MWARQQPACRNILAGNPGSGAPVKEALASPERAVALARRQAELGRSQGAGAAAIFSVPNALEYDWIEEYASSSATTDRTR